VLEIRVESGETTSRSVVYEVESTAVGAVAGVLDSAEVTDPSLPYAYVGQLRSELGRGSGCVIRSGVVATAAHVVLNHSPGEGQVRMAEGLQWLFQREAGLYEPEPRVPRGAYWMEGYVDARNEPGVVPGEGTAATQHHDVAMLFFVGGAGRGGFSGYRYGGSQENSYLTGRNMKVLVGYPTQGVAAGDVGRMHATPPMRFSMDQVPGEVAPGRPFATYLTEEISSAGGASGGPLCVLDDNLNRYFPVGVYIGGTNQTVVRGFDAEVLELIIRAEVSSTGGDDNTDGGSSQTDYVSLGTNSELGGLRVTLGPDWASSAGGMWRRLREGAAEEFMSSGATLFGLTPGEYRIEFSDVSGLETPAPMSVTVEGDTLTQVSVDYGVPDLEMMAWREHHFGTSETNERTGNDRDPDGDGSNNMDEFIAGTDPDDGSDRFEVLSIERVGMQCVVRIAARAGRVYELQLLQGMDPAGGGARWVTRTSAGPFEGDIEVPLTDFYSASDSGIYRVSVTKP